MALIYAPSDDPYDEPSSGSDYWYNEKRNGRVLTGVEKEWADEYAAMQTRSEKYEHHLRAAGLRAAQAMAEGYATMVSGVLLGMSEALKQSTPTKSGKSK